MSKTTERLVTGLLITISLPILFAVILLSPIYLGLLKALRSLGIWRGWRRVDLFGDELTFSWSCKDAAEAETVLASAVSMLVELFQAINPTTKVASMRFLNPESGMVLEQHCLRKITTDFGPEAARLLVGNHVEHGMLLINGKFRFENLDLDLRSPLSGHFSLELPDPPAPRAFSTIAARHGFQPGHPTLWDRS